MRWLARSEWSKIRSINLSKHYFIAGYNQVVDLEMMEIMLTDLRSAFSIDISKDKVSGISSFTRHRLWLWGEEPIDRRRLCLELGLVAIGGNVLLQIRQILHIKCLMCSTLGSNDSLFRIIFLFLSQTVTYPWIKSAFSILCLSYLQVIIYVQSRKHL